MTKNCITSLPFSTTIALLAVASSALGLGACDGKKKPDPPQVEEKAEVEKSPKAEETTEKPAPILGHRFPVGPPLVFLPGKGVGAIRFGATVETIERHMQAPCDKKTEDRCLYVRAAVEFFLEDGVVKRIKAHRRDRKVTDPPADGEKFYGSLSGLVQPRIMMLLHRHVVLEEFGEPKKKEEISPPGSDGLVERHFYDGINLEYDKIENGNVVLSGIEIYPSETPYAAPRADGGLTPPPLRPLPQGALPNSERAR